MPKVPRKDAKAALQETPMAVDMEAGHEQAGQEQPGLPDKPNFTPLSAAEQGGKLEFRRVPVPQHRMTPLKTHWLELFKPITENLRLDMRMNLKTKKAGHACSHGMLHNT
ncbi:hypothetical protein QJQ45_019513 [Haematococcus lacustris]|nr:hypothetical protein QJQ45_019513 [Haematococcus lacustris]